MCGFARQTCSTTAYLGSTSDGWGLHSSAAGAWNIFNGGGATLVSGAAVVPAVGTRPGMIWQPSTGKVWAVINGTVYGNPEAGTGHTHSGVTGTILPAVAPRLQARVRILTHAREQTGRPSYAEAWAGSDLLPELHYKGLLGNDPYIEQGIWFPIPWGGDRSGAPIGAIEVLNNDGEYDALSDYMLRNQRVAIDRVWPNESTPEAEARAIVSSMSMQGEARLRVLCDSILSQLEVHVPSEIFVLGKPFIIPGTQRGTDPTQIEFAQTPYMRLLSVAVTASVRDQYTDVSTYRQLLTENSAKLVRTVSVAGKHSIKECVIEYPYLESAVTNGTFASWTGDNPDNWTVTNENGTTSYVTQVGSAARCVRQAGAPALSITTSDSPDQGFLKIVVSAYVSGSITINPSGTYPANVAITGAGTFYAPVNESGPFTIQFADTTDLTIDTITFINTEDTRTLGRALTYLINILGGISDDETDLIVGGESSVVTYYATGSPTILRVVNELANRFNVAIYVDGAGVIRRATLDDPDSYDSSDAEWLGSVTESDLRSALSVEDDRAPALSTTVATMTTVNYGVHTFAEVAGGVSDADRLEATRPYESGSLSAPPAFYAHAENAAPLFSHATLPYAERRRFYDFEIDAGVVRRWKPGGFFELTHTRFGLSSGKNLMVANLSRSATSPTVRVKAWG
jgi:hypothetical protein